jgi:hypothetical protein
LYSEVIGPNLDKNRVALPKPANQEYNLSNQQHKLSDVIGIVVSMEKGDPYIQTRRAPTGLGSMPEREIKQIETKTHEKIDSTVKSHKGQANLDGGLKYE